MADIESGALERLTYRQAKSYTSNGRSLKTNDDIQTVQRQLVGSGHLVRKGKQFLSTMHKLESQDEPSYRDDIADRIVADLKSGWIDRLTYPIGRHYGLKTDADVKVVQEQLHDAGMLVKRGRLYVKAEHRGVA